MARLRISRWIIRRGSRKLLHIYCTGLLISSSRNPSCVVQINNEITQTNANIYKVKHDHCTCLSFLSSCLFESSTFNSDGLMNSLSTSNMPCAVVFCPSEVSRCSSLLPVPTGCVLARVSQSAAAYFSHIYLGACYS